jgi:death on curing protein
MTRYLTVEQVLFIHARIIQETGGSHGIHNLGLLESAVMRPKATFEGKELYSDVVTKAAALMHSLIRNHPFVDGNKRTGIAAAGLLLEQNGVRLTAANPDLVAITLSVAASPLDIESIAAWLEANSQS